MRPRRKYLDNILVDAAVAAGAELREGFSVQELLWEGDRVVGIRGHAARGRNRDRARAHRHRRRRPILAGRPQRRRADLQRAPDHDLQLLQLLGRHARSDAFEFYRRDDVVMLAFPTNDGLACVAIQAPPADFPVFRADIEGNFARTLARFPELAARVRRGGAPSASRARPTCPTSSASPTARAGRWSAMRAITRTR